MSKATTPRSRVEIGRANREKGIRAERHVAGYLRACGWPDAERKSDPGWRSSDRASPDVGDVRGTPGLVWQVKTSSDLSSRDIAAVLAEATDQAVAAGADYPIVVQRRSGKGHPSAWWAWLTAGDLHGLIETTRNQDLPAPDQVMTAPVRLELGNLVPLLHRAGYGQGDADA